MKKIVALIGPLLVFSGIVSMGTAFWEDPGSAFAMEGSRIGNTWTDSEGNNYEGDPSSGSSSSSGYQYTYGYTNNSGGSTYTGPTWEERQEANRLRAEAKQQQKAVKVNDEGVVYANKGDSRKALEYYQKAAAIDPTNPTIQNNIRLAQGTIYNDEGIQHYSSGNYQIAAEAYRKALELKPESDVIRQNLADAEQQLAFQQEYQRKEAVKKAEMGVAGTKIQGMLTNLSQSLKPKAQPPALSFKPAEVPITGYEGDRQITHKDELAFKGMEPKRPVLEARPAPSSGESQTAQGQLKSVEFHSRIAAASGSYEGMKGNSAIGFDTKGVPGDELPGSGAVHVPEVVGVALGEVLPSPVPAERRTPAIEKFETERGELFTKRKEIETKVAEMEETEKPDTVEIVKLREEATQIKNKENFLSFQITDELAKAPEVKQAGPVDPKAEKESDSGKQ